jgi:hypothetical protein
VGEILRKSSAFRCLDEEHGKIFSLGHVAEAVEQHRFANAAKAGRYHAARGDAASKASEQKKVDLGNEFVAAGQAGGGEPAPG